MNLKKIKRGISMSVFLSIFSLSANASNDGKLCEGFPNAIVCAPFQAGIFVAYKLSPSYRMHEAIEAGDLSRVKRLLGSAPEVSPENTLYSVAKAYVGQSAPSIAEEQFKIVEYILNNYQIDMAGHRSMSLLNLTLWDPVYSGGKDKGINRRISLAKILTAHGAKGDKLNLSRCFECHQDTELLTLLIRSGANPSPDDALEPHLLDKFIEKYHFDAAKQLLDLGANPNGSWWNRKSMLSRIVEQCAAGQEACVQGSIERVKFAIEHGADPNGRASRKYGCVTPHESAISAGNSAMASALVRLGADPDYAQRCRSPAPARS